MSEHVHKERVFLPAESRQYMLLAGSLVFAFGSLLISDDSNRNEMLFSFLFFLLCAVIFIAQLARRAPQLRLTPKGLEFKAIWNTHWAEWNSLGRSVFRETTTYNTTVRTIEIEVIGSNVSKSLRNKKKIVVTGEFREPYESLVESIQAYQTASAGVQSESSHNDEDWRYGIESFNKPWATIFILIMLGLIFIGEMVITKSGDNFTEIEIGVFVALGGLNAQLVINNGEWLRFFTAPLLHANLVHLALNGIAMFMVGLQLEKLIGRAWLAGVFAIGGLGGSLASFLINPDTIISVGASGAIMGLIGAALAVSCRLPSLSNWRAAMQTRATQYLVPAILPIFFTSHSHIDYAAHLGGAIAGGLVGIVLLKTWPDDERLPKFRGLAQIIAIASFALALVGFGTAFNK